MLFAELQRTQARETWREEITAISGTLSGMMLRCIQLKRSRNYSRRDVRGLYAEVLQELNHSWKGRLVPTACQIIESLLFLYQVNDWTLNVTIDWFNESACFSLTVFFLHWPQIHSLLLSGDIHGFLYSSTYLQAAKLFQHKYHFPNCLHFPSYLSIPFSCSCFMSLGSQQLDDV